MHNATSEIDPQNEVVRLCAAGARAEFERRPDDARALYQQAWDAASDHCEAAIAAHYVARFAASAQEALHWNQVALSRAEAATAGSDPRVAPFYPSLYLSLGKAHEALGDHASAKHVYDRATALGAPHRQR